MRIKTANPEHEVAYQDICALVNKHASSLSAMEVLAVAANMVGKLVALQDQRTTTPEIAMRTVAANIEAGNQMVLDQLRNSKGRG